MTMTPQVTQDGFLSAKKVSPWRAILSAVCYLIFYFAIQIVVEIGYGIYLGATLPLVGLSEEAANELINQALYRDGNYLMIIIDVLIFLVLAIVFLARGKTFAEGMGMKKTKPTSVLLAFVVGLGLTCALGFVMLFVESLFPAIMEDYGNTMDESYNMQSLISYILAGVIGAPLIEELIFRHLITGRLDRGIPRIVAILVGSVIFGVIHLHPVQMVYAAGLGFVMACMYFAYDSIWVPIAIHAGFNSLSVLSYVQALMKTESQQMIFGLCLLLCEVALVLFGAIALIHLLISRPHKIFKREVSPVQAVPVPAPTPVPASLYHNSYYTSSSSIPTVATFSANIPTVETVTTPDSAEPTKSTEPIESGASVASEEASSSDETGGNL